MAKAREIKPVVDFGDTFGRLDIRVGRIVDVRLEPSAPCESYRLVVNFGRFGEKTSVARLTCHGIDELRNKLVLGVLNFPPKRVGDVVSEVLILGVQCPGAESGVATYVTPAKDVKLGSKLF